MPPPGEPRPREPGVRSRRRGQRLCPWARHLSEGRAGQPRAGWAQGGRRTGPCALLPSAFSLLGRLGTSNSGQPTPGYASPRLSCGLGHSRFLSVRFSLPVTCVRVFLSISVICLSVFVHICHLSLSIVCHLSVFHLSSIPYLYLSPVICLS